MIITTKFGVVAAGRLGKAPEVRTVGEKGTKLVKFSIAAYKDEQEQNTWIDVTAWGGLADYAEQLNKGDSVLVAGQKNTHTYKNREGEEKTASELTAEFIMLQPSQINVIAPPDYPNYSSTPYTAPSQNTGVYGAGGYASSEELPF